jgi:outer membrane protein assembly factor BamB
MANKDVATLLVIAAAGQIVGVDALSGKERWRRPVGNGPVALVIRGGRIYASSRAPTIHCFDHPSGEPRWSWQTSAHGRASIVIEGEHLYLAKGGEVECFTLDGHRLWGAPAKLGLGGSAALGFPGNVMQADEDT